MSQGAVCRLLPQALDKLKAAEVKKEEERKVLSPTELVAQRLSMAAAAAANAAAPLANNISSFTSAAASTVSLSAVTSQLQARPWDALFPFRVVATLPACCGRTACTCAAC